MFKERHGWRPERLLWERKAAAQVLIQDHGRFRIGYVPKGPILNWSELDQAKETLHTLENLAQANALLLLKIDPDVNPDTPEGQAIKELLAQRGWKPSFEQIQFRNTMILNLQPDLDTILDAMKSKWRYNIRLADRKGVQVRCAALSELPVLYEMYAETARRDRFIIRDAAYYTAAWRTFIEAGQAIPLMATVGEDYVSALILFYFDKRAWYMYGASRDIHRKFMPNHLLQWEAIKQAKALGCTEYDMWGAPDVLEESDPMWGVYRFKEGFGAEFVPHIGAYDYAPHPALYRLYAFLRPRQVSWAQKRYWRQHVSQTTTT
ncbi:MAG: peptidoglycan bridge formation glycyltransferase FemA/FemB family protein [Anaerolineae bacterium]|nr:peptidoglycan bridge formation glycyltransferase FemA/FemB family protein [Anaerolineae bacterium]